ncbi:VapE family protein [Komagataeibacter rhaeticus]|nr:VapE family protein [Komagataeibacter rhaeticus]
MVPTNECDYLTDPTGNRRYWPISCTRADPDWVAAHRSQLWAEADHREATSPMPLWLDDPAIAITAQAAQEARLPDDPWHDPIAAWLAGRGRAACAWPMCCTWPLACRGTGRTARPSSARAWCCAPWAGRATRCAAVAPPTGSGSRAGRGEPPARAAPPRVVQRAGDRRWRGLMAAGTGPVSMPCAAGVKCMALLCRTHFPGA